MTKVLNVLVVDDIAANCRLVCRFVESLGHRSITANDGQEAIEAFKKQTPDLILMDIMMPVMDGIQAAAEIRKLCGDNWLPIIFLSAKNSEVDQLEVLDIGDDFLPKPVNLRMLGAKIKVMARIGEMQQRITDHSTSLAVYRVDSEREQQFAAQLLEQIIRNKENATGLVTSWLQPAKHFSGDVIVRALTPESDLHCLIADSTGHGLAAAICTLPVVDIFFSMTEKGFKIDEIVREVNAKLHLLLPTGRFVAAAIVCVNQTSVQMWNGGIPFAAYMTQSGKVIKEWPSMYPPLGMMSNATFDATLDVWAWPDAGQVFISSDGIVEAENSSGEFFGEEGLIATIENSQGKSTFEAIVSATQLHLGELENRDDLSLVAIACGFPKVLS